MIHYSVLNVWPPRGQTEASGFLTKKSFMFAKSCQFLNSPLEEEVESAQHAILFKNWHDLANKIFFWLKSYLKPLGRLFRLALMLPLQPLLLLRVLPVPCKVLALEIKSWKSNLLKCTKNIFRAIRTENFLSKLISTLFVTFTNHFPLHTNHILCLWVIIFKL